MKKYLTITLITLLSYTSYAQINYEKGYFIDNDGNRTECLIKNIDWGNNPIEFNYKLTENDKQKKVTIELAKEFGIYNISKYQRHTVNIDKSSNNVQTLSKIRKPIFKEEVLFLKVLVEGKASLYFYEYQDIKRFFYDKNDFNIQQLIYKEYLISDDVRIRENNRYKQQLLNHLNCKNIKKEAIKNIEYKKTDLVNYFIKYNKCNNSESTIHINKQKRDLINLSIRPGVNYSSLLIYRYNPQPKIELPFENNFGSRVGLEIEYIIPFKKNKWALLIEPTYQYYKDETEWVRYIGTQGYNIKETVNVDYKSIEVHIGLRHYFILNDASKFFVNAITVVDIDLKNKIDFNNTPINFSEKDSNAKGVNFAFGLGYKYNDNISLEIRLQSNRGIILSSNSWSSRYKTSSLILGYTLF